LKIPTAGAGSRQARLVNRATIGTSTPVRVAAVNRLVLRKRAEAALTRLLLLVKHHLILICKLHLQILGADGTTPHLKVQAVKAIPIGVHHQQAVPGMNQHKQVVRTVGVVALRQTSRSNN
jgi:hypothetical protein